MRKSDRATLAAGLSLLASCHGKPADDAGSAKRAVAERAKAAAADPNAIACAPAGAAAFGRACTVDQENGPGGQVLTLRNPDGGFHRLLVTGDGRGVAAADGAQPISVRIAGDDTIEVAIAHDRYRLPATVRHRP